MPKNLYEYPDHLAFLAEFIPYLERTNPDHWALKRVRVGEQNCLFGHFVAFCEFDPSDNVAPAWDWFESNISTPFVVYPINDGENPDYPQATAKERCIAYLKNIEAGVELTTHQAMEQDYEKYCRERD